MLGYSRISDTEIRLSAVSLMPLQIYASLDRNNIKKNPLLPLKILLPPSRILVQKLEF